MVPAPLKSGVTPPLAGTVRYCFNANPQAGYHLITTVNLLFNVSIGLGTVLRCSHCIAIILSDKSCTRYRTPLHCGWWILIFSSHYTREVSKDLLHPGRAEAAVAFYSQVLNVYNFGA